MEEFNMQNQTVDITEVFAKELTPVELEEVSGADHTPPPTGRPVCCVFDGSGGGYCGVDEICDDC